MKEYTLADKRSLKPYDANTAKNWEEFLKEMKKKGKALDAHKTKLFVEKIVREIENKEPVESTRLDDILEEEDLVVDKPLEQAERQEVVNSSEDEVSALRGVEATSWEYDDCASARSEATSIKNTLN
ncbi:hypothetical protein TL16_g00576 [Triparma laevis f. inornata]|uniref:Uncharacterized protein n=1 Tax=Triparma laevis f. inornata TaxID=1714386 RepID=A0A9W6ZE76_9STRA|nr:hypothetical protein TL16_g00576 [Triparma laevis f. inornata]